MFDDVTKREGGERAARRFRYLVGSSVVQAAAVALVALLTVHLRADVEGPVVPVAIVRSATTIAPPLRPPAPERAGLRGRTAPPSPEVEGRPSSGARPQDRRAAVRPKAATREPEDRHEPPSDQGDGELPDGEPEGDEHEGQSRQAGVAGGAAGATSPLPGAAVDDAPAYATAGWRRPEQARRNCVQDSVRIPRGLQGFVSGPITVKFAVGSDGAPSQFQVLATLPDSRIGAAIWQAIQACRWVPGADARGQPARIWVTMPIRFVSG